MMKVGGLFQSLRVILVQLVIICQPFLSLFIKQKCPSKIPAKVLKRLTKQLDALGDALLHLETVFTEFVTETHYHAPKFRDRLLARTLILFSIPVLMLTVKA